MPERLSLAVMNALRYCRVRTEEAMIEMKRRQLEQRIVVWEMAPTSLWPPRRLNFALTLLSYQDRQGRLHSKA